MWFGNALYHLNNHYLKQNNKRFLIDEKKRQIYYKQNENIDENRFIDGDINEIHNLLKSDCNTINEHLIQYYAFNVVEKVYEYYNPNLIRNQGLIKYVPKHYCAFPTSVTAFV